MPRSPRKPHLLIRSLAVTACALAGYAQAVDAAWVNVALGNGEVTLILGTAPNPLATVGPVVVNFSVPAAQVGNGVAIAGTPNVEVQLGVRRFWFFAPSQADLNVSAPATIDSGPNQIPISSISWTTAAATGTPGGTELIAGGTLSAGSQTIHSLNPPAPFLSWVNSWAGAVFTFRYANTQIYPAGSYGPATITFTAYRN
ncbi:MAG: hypothetical protein AMS22_09895 [Thiotrichales bacterium SG8_50]|jgi:hypothetical protein|nr:MAG: hypothetical protein AMS22_09895 [Thiotrichales bacterium SG8_50]